MLTGGGEEGVSVNNQVPKLLDLDDTGTYRRGINMQNKNINGDKRPISTEAENKDGCKKAGSIFK